jgi:hypothetical protein
MKSTTAVKNARLRKTAACPQFILPLYEILLIALRMPIAARRMVAAASSSAVRLPALVVDSRFCNRRKPHGSQSCRSALLSDARRVHALRHPPMINRRRSVTNAARFNPETITLMRRALDDAWDCLEPEAQATVLKTTLAVRILESASQGERDRKRLRDAALSGLAA